MKSNWPVKTSEESKMQLSNLLETIKSESKNLEGRGQLDGLHNLVRQNVSLSRIYVKLIASINDLNRTTTILTIVVIVLMIVGIILTIIQIYLK